MISRWQTTVPKKKKKRTLRTVSKAKMIKPITPEMEGKLSTYAEKTYGSKLKEGWRERLRGVR